MGGSKDGDDRRALYWYADVDHGGKERVVGVVGDHDTL